MNTTALFASTRKRHSKELFHICFYTMWGMFSFYGMKALLIAYIVTQLRLGEPNGYAILGTYSALVFGLPFIGGMISDQYLGARKSIIWGSLLQIAGHFILAIPLLETFFAGLALVACGCGFGFGNDTALVGSLYNNTDARRKDEGFSIFYMLLNLGAALGGLICGYVGEKINWHYGFGLAGIFMILGLLNFIYGINASHGAPPDIIKLKKPIFLQVNREWAIYLSSFMVVAVVTMLFQRTALMDIILPLLTTLSFLYLFYISYRFSKAERWKIFAAMVVFLINSFFIIFYEQSAGALSLFILRNVDLQVGSTTLPGLAINSFTPPFLLFVLTPVFIKLWNVLHKRNLEPRTPLKLVISFVFMALCFVVIWLGCYLYASTGMVPLLFLIMGYFFMECSEINIGPVSYSLISKLSPLLLASTMMGLLYLSIALGQFTAGKLGSLMSIPEDITNPILSLPFYSNIFLKIAGGCGVIAIVVWVLYPLLRKWMQDVR